jgi:type IV pilus assembly protein PilN
VLPTGVQVLSIDPEVDRDGKVTIRLRVSGARDRAVELVKNLEKSRHFASPRLAAEALATATGTGPNAAVQPINASIPVNFDILAYYRPLSDVEEKQEEAGTSSEKAQPSEKAVPSEKAPPAAKKSQAKPGAVAAARRGAQ